MISRDLGCRLAFPGRPGQAALLIWQGLIGQGLIGEGRVGEGRIVRRGVGGLGRESRASVPVAGGPDVEDRAVPVIVGGRVRNRRAGLVVNSHISA